MDEAEFSVATELAENNSVVVRITGEFDVYTAPRVREHLLVATAVSNLVVDLAGVTFLDSSALGVLVGAYKRVVAGHGTFAVINASDRLCTTMEMTGLHRILNVQPT